MTDPRLTIIRCERCGVGGDEVARLLEENRRLIATVSSLYAILEQEDHADHMAEEAQRKLAHEHAAAVAEVHRLEAENRRLRETCLPILHMAEALHRRWFGMKCDHDEDCWCDEEAQSSETLRRARAALEGDA